MYVSKTIKAGHEDLIHDVAYNFYGNRMATCSSDQHVKIWDMDESGNWTCTAKFKTHSGAVWKVNWASPEFGQVIATCSFDRTAAVWEEIPGAQAGGAQSHWMKKAPLVDSRTSVTDVKFGPKHLGLILATCSSDGTIRIYEAPDVMNLSQWSLQHEIHCKMPCSCISWNPSLSRLHPPMLAVGSDESNSSNSSQGKVSVYEYSENNRRWHRVETFNNVNDPVHDIAFAPNIGRSYHVLAIGSKDLRIFTLKPLQDAKEESGRFEIKQAAIYDEHAVSVWRVCWNVTGTILATSGDDGQVKLWKCNYMDRWKCISTLKSDSQANEATRDELGKLNYKKLAMQAGHTWH